MKANELCPAPHLEAADLNGKDVVLTIEKVGFNNVGQAQVKKGIVYFSDADRGLVLNRTNTKRIIGIYGNETDSWVGKKITLYPSEADFQGNTVPCIRVREKAPE
jgi:hypothetical protein